MTRPFVNLARLGSACFGGDARLMIWTLAWDNHAVLNRLPLFDANIFYPATASLSYNEHLFGLSLFSLPIYATTRNPVLAYNVLWLLSFVVSGLAMHALAFRHTRSQLAAFTAGLVYAFCFYKMHHAYGHLSLIWVWLLPFSLVLLERWIEQPTLRRAAVWAVAVVLQALTSWYLAVIVVIANAMSLAWMFAIGVRSQWSARLRQLVVVGLAAVAVMVPFARHYGALETPTRAELMSLSADWASYLIPPENTWLGQWWLAHIGAGPRWIWGEQTLFLGCVAIGLAATGIGMAVLSGRWRIGGGYLLVMILGFALSFGPWVVDGQERLSAFSVLAMFPGISGIRAAARFAVLVMLGLALFAGYGVAAIETRFGRRGALAVALLLPLMLSEWFVINLPGGPPTRAEIPTIYRSALLQSARALVSLPEHRGTPEWPIDADYLYYSTVHWRPIVNGFGRAEPPMYAGDIAQIDTFPSSDSAKRMKQMGVDYVVLHAGRYPNGAAAILQGARTSPDYELVGQVGTDFLFHVKQ
jgi:hypothetical protein